MRLETPFEMIDQPMETKFEVLDDLEEEESKSCAAQISEGESSDGGKSSDGGDIALENPRNKSILNEISSGASNSAEDEKTVFVELDLELEDTL